MFPVRSSSPSALASIPLIQVTDTTTFTSEKRRQQEDAWLYETCTKCLQHLVDLFVEVGAGVDGVDDLLIRCSCLRLQARLYTSVDASLLATRSKLNNAGS